MSQGSVRVLIPTYEPKQALLQEALDSLLMQTHADWTAVIQDDASKADVIGMVSSYLKDTRITFRRSDVRLGIGGNWNACLRHENDSTYIAFLFQDDVWSPTYLEHALEALRKTTSATFVSMGHRYAYEGMEDVTPLYEAVLAARKRITPGAHRGKETLRSWIEAGLTPNIIGEPSFVVMRHDAVKKAGVFLEDMPQFLDVEYWTRLLQIGDWMMLHGDEGVFRVHAEGASAGNEQAGRGLFDRLRCLGLLVRALEGEERSIAKSARQRALQKMVGKFFRRLREGRRVSAQGSGEMKAFVLRHPIQVIGATLGFFIRGDK